MIGWVSLAVFNVVPDNLASMLSSSECAMADWQITAGYTFSTARCTQSTSSAAAGDHFATDPPRHLFKLFITCRLPGEWRAWRVGGGVRLRSEICKNDGSARIRQGGHASTDLMLAWQTALQLDLRLNIHNVFDMSYGESIMSTSDNNGFGAPRKCC